MRGDPQAASARLLAAVPGPRWPSWLALAKQRRERNRREELEVMERLGAEQRRARRAGEYAPDLRRLW
jgi:hypothetical protein